MGKAMLVKVLFLYLSSVCLAFGYEIENSIVQELNSNYYRSQHKDKFSDEHYNELVKALEASCQMRLMSYNVLSQFYDSLQKEQNTWAHRKDRVIALIDHISPDVFCCQELTPIQIDDFKNHWGDKYGTYAPLPSDDRCFTEMLGIFYNKEKFDLKYSEKREIGISHYSHELGSYCFQYYIKVHLVEKKSGKEFVLYNTHADYLKPEGRLELVKSLLESAEKDAESYPTILAGDFNTKPSMLPAFFEGYGLPAFDSNYLLQLLTKNGFRNTLDLPLIAHIGPFSTFTMPQQNLVPFTDVDYFGSTLDHIFVTPNTIKTIFHAIEPAQVNGHYPSDHVPVFVDLSIP